VTPRNCIRPKAPIWRQALVLLVAVPLFCGALGVLPAKATTSAQEFSAQLASDEERTLFSAYISAQSRHAQALDTYWHNITEKRALRRKKRAADQPLTVEDYVQSFPPDYAGPKLTADLAKRWTAFTTKKAEDGPPPKPRPGLKEFLESARSQFDFVPERIPEREFKKRYAREALALGLTKEQVVRIYALETSGLGTADMVAGIHPIKRTGKPISTAIGYAQLLAANSSSELVKSGPAFIERLQRIASSSNVDFDRAARATAKIEVLRKMIVAAKAVPNTWDSHVNYARTAKGMGIHSINIDGDIGPWLQVIKIRGLKDTADRKGMNNLAGAEIELMNLAGPMTGIEMMRPAGRKVPTANFFERQAYARNTIVRGKTSEQLIQALDQRMNENITNAGAVEFNAVFDEVAAERQAQR
jgi:hypothetical protein